MNETKSGKIQKCDFVKVFVSKYHVYWVLLLEITNMLLSNYVTVFTVISK